MDTSPSGLAADIAARTDVYFNRTRQVVERFGDRRVTYAVFLRRPVVSAPRLMLDWINEVAAARGTHFEINVTHPEGTWTGAGEPLVYISGSFSLLSDLETIMLQKIGPACVAAHNAYQMCLSLPGVAFWPMVPPSAALPHKKKALKALSAMPMMAPRIGMAARAAWAPCRTL